MLKIKIQLSNDIEAFCKLNDIHDPEKFCNDILEKAFLIEKYGSAPQIFIKPELNEIEPKIENITIIPEEKKILKIEKNDDYDIYDI